MKLKDKEGNKAMTTRTMQILAVLLLLALLSIPQSAFASLTPADASAVWRRVERDANLPKMPFSVKEDKVPNAWVKNGESVTVTTKLLDLLDNKTELYGIFAHEAGHICLGHYEKLVSRNAGVGALALVLGKIFDSEFVNIAASVGSGLALAGFSREQEVQADDFSVRLSFNHGSDPAGLYHALQRIVKFGGETQPSGFNSHPPDERRLYHIKKEILKLDPNAKVEDIK